jgi:MoaA/NifB/PqqE/SkfB family radical SAM enzyme
MFKGHPALDTADALILIERLADHIEELVFGGGDPLLRKDLPTLINQAFDKNLRVEIQTNAQVLSKDFVKSVKDQVVRWGFSLDSWDPKVHDAIRGRVGNHKRVVEAAALLADEGIDWNLRTLVARPTLSTVEPIGDWLQSIGFRGNWYLLQYTAVGDEMQNRQQFEISDSEFLAIVEPIVLKYNQSAFHTLPVPDGDRRNIYFLIAPDGAVYNHPPCGHPYVVVGNILSETFDNLLERLSIDFQAHYRRYGIPEKLRAATDGLSPQIPMSNLANTHGKQPGKNELFSTSQPKPFLERSL